MSTPTLTLLTDFGGVDGYVGAMKGVLLARTGGCTLVDLSHDVPRGDVARGAYVLAQAAPWFPEGTVHVAVVDPGVGGTRRAIALLAEGHFYVAPDNGLLSDVLAAVTPERVYAIESERYAPRDASPVFHGRDVFAPAAAHLALGGDGSELGRRIDPASLVRLPRPEPTLESGDWLATIVHVDHFGNLVTNVALPSEHRAGVARIDAVSVPLCATYSDVDPGELVAVRGSTGRLEIAVRDGSAAERLGKARGDVIRWRAVER